MPVGVKVRKVKKGQRVAKENQPAQFVENQDTRQISVGGIEIKKDGILKDQHNSSREVQVHSIQRKFTIFISTLRINQFRLYLRINSEVRDLRPQAQQQQYQNLSQASTQCGSIATVLSSSNQGGFSGQRLNINYLSESGDLDSGIVGQEICASFPYSIGSGLPHHLQEPWGALIDSGAVTSIAPSSFAPHIPITPHSGQLVNVNGGEIKIKGQKKVTYVTHMVVMHITFLIVEDVLNPIMGLDALHQNAVQFHLFQRGKAYLQQKSQKAVLHYHKNHYYASGLVLSGYVKRSILKWDDPQYTIFDPQSTSQIIAEIDLEVNSQARITQPQEEEDVSLEAQKPQCLKTPESVTAAEREAHSLTHMPFRSWRTVCQRAKGQHQHHKGNQKLTSVIQLDHSFYKVPGEIHNLKVLTFVETTTSMSGAVIVPDLSANQVAIKTLKKFIAVNGFTKSVLQCDGHSGLLALQEQVGHEMSLPTQIRPLYSHQSQGTVERFH